MILRTRKNKNYTTLCNVALNDPALSLKAKGLFAFLMSKPDDWRISYRGLTTQLKEGKDAILGALKELEDAGYLQRSRRQTPSGKLIWESVLQEETMRGKPAHGKNGGQTMRGKTARGKPAHIVNTDKEKLNKKTENAGSSSKLQTKRPELHTGPTSHSYRVDPKTTALTRKRIREALRMRQTRQLTVSVGTVLNE